MSSKDKCTFEVIRRDGASFYSIPKTYLIVNEDTYLLSKQVGKYLLDNKPELEELSYSQLLERVDEISITFAYTKLLKYLRSRDYTSFQLRSKLETLGYSEVVVDKVIAKASDEGFVDDAKFCEKFINLKKDSGWGPYKIEMSLNQKGINTQDIDGWPDKYFEEESELNRAIQILSRKSTPARNANTRLLRFLLNRGFDSRIAKKAVKTHLKNNESKH